MKKTIHSKRYEAFCGLLVEARKDADLTQKNVADKLAKPQSFVAKYEGGERRLDVVEFLEIAAILGADAAKLIKKLKIPLVTRRLRSRQYAIWSASPE